MAKFQCTICGHIHEGLEAPEKCPICKAPSSKFTVIDKGAQKATKLQKINEEDYEIIKKLENDGFVKAVEWYTKAAIQGDPWAQNHLAACYEFSKGVKKSYNKAVQWYTKAAKQGYAIAQYNLAECYEIGRGVKKSIDKAIEWYTMSAKQGNQKAKEKLLTLL